MTTLKVSVIRRPQIKVKALVKFPANVVGGAGINVTNAGGTYTFDIDNTEVASIFGSTFQPTDATLTVLAALDSTAGLLTQTGSDTFAKRTLAGTGNEITVTNGAGTAGNPTLSIPSALTFTGKTITGGTYSGAVSYNKVVITAPATSATLTLIDGTTLTGPAVSGTVATLANPAFTGVPTAPTAAPQTNTTQIATTAFVIANGSGDPLWLLANYR